MKIRGSHILIVLAILLFIVGVFVLFIKQPIEPVNQKQKELYDSSLYQYLAKSGKEKKAWVSLVKNNKKDETSNITVKFFNEHGKTLEAQISLVKLQYNEGDFVDILYNPNNPQQARILPRDETKLNWSSFGWCMTMGIVLLLIGIFRRKVSGGIE